MVKNSSILNFFSKGQLKKFNKGQIIINPDLFAEDVFYIKKGYVKIYAVEFGEEKLHILTKRGEIFPLAWVFDNSYKSFTAEAIDDVELYQKSRSEFIEFIHTSPVAALEIIGKLVNTINTYSERVNNLAITKSYPKIVARILFFSRRFGKKSGSDIIIQIPLTQSDIAHSLAMTRETTSRELKKLEDKKLIVYQNHTIIIKNEQLLLNELSE